MMRVDYDAPEGMSRYLTGNRPGGLLYSLPRI
jgi:hypothetical protein